MVRRLARVISLIRDVALALLSFAIISSQYSRLGEEQSFFVTITISAVVLTLCIVDVVLVILNKGRGAMTGIATVQVAMGIFWLLLVPAVGLVMIVASAAVLAMLRQKKTPEELLRNPPVPRTRRYRVAVGAGILLALASLFLPWFSATVDSVSLYDVYRAIATHSGGLPSVSIGPSQVLFALLAVFCSPIAAVGGALALRWRRVSLAAGLFAIVVGGGFVIAFGGAEDPGSYVLTAAGSVMLVGFFVFRGRASGQPG